MSRPAGTSTHPAGAPARRERGLTVGDLVPETGDRLSFRAFMERALYDPRFGYYTTGIREVGRRGDFSTSPTLDPLFGRAISRWIRDRSQPAGRKTHIIEVGAGNGALADAVLTTLGWWRRRSIRYHIVEISPRLRQLQRQRLVGRAVAFHDSMPAAMEAAEGSAIVISNELVDAFPVNVYQWDTQAGSWGEVFIERTTAGAVVEAIHPPDPTPEPLPTSTADNWPDGQRIEIPWTYHDWLGSWIPACRRLHLLTIDYGDVHPAVYHRRPSGTLRGYYHHQRTTGSELYRHVGRQDLTADVDFTRIMRWGEALGLVTRRLQCQKDFLQELLAPREIARHSGIPSRQPDPIPPIPTPLALDAVGPGTAFKVLEQQLD